MNTVYVQGPKMTEETKLSVLCSLFDWIQKSKSSTQKRSKFRKFIDTFCKPDDYFSAIRLIIPNLDRERGSYGLKESILATCLIDALGMSRESEDALRLINWRKGGAKTGINAGNFALVAAEVLQRRQGITSGGLTIKELNDLLDRLASSESRADKMAVLSTLINKTNAQEMKWIIMIILKDLKLGVSEKSIFREFHPDAEDLFNVTCDLKLVCDKLRDRTQRHKRQDIEVGKAVRPQLAMRVADATSAWKKLHGKEVIVECKFDGDRIQVHKSGTELHYFSRNFLDHSEYAHGMSDIIIQNVLVDRCILDGEMLVWDTSLNRFSEFGSNQEIAKAARDGLQSDGQLCYVAFDILYVGDSSVIHRSLKERHEILRQIVKPLNGRLEILLPNAGLNSHRCYGEPCWSFIARSADEVERFFKETVENRDEGIVLKDLGSKWEPSDRSGKWLKLKPEYIHPSSDLDVLIIGGYYGSGRHGGEVAQFLVGLAERPTPNTYPRRFVSFCRLGAGLSDDELGAVVTKLKPYFRKNDYPKKSPPSFYHVTNNSKERPDIWIDSPDKSIILSITSDIRTIRSEVFAAPYSLRFPRIDRVRFDKPWHECLDVQSFIELVHSSNGNTQRGTDYGGVRHTKPKRTRSFTREEKRNMSVVPSHLVQTDISGVKEDTLIFSNMIFYFVNVPTTLSLDSLHKMVVENGGAFSMNLTDSVTHCVAAESKGIKYQAAKLRGDIIHYPWLLDCCSQKKLLPLQPKYFLFLSDSTKKLQEEIDVFSDPYYCDIDLADIKQLLSNVKTSEDTKTINHYKKKYCPLDKWSHFNDCYIYFHVPPDLKPDWEVLLTLAMKRLQIEVCMGGGNLTARLARATHLVVLSAPGSDVYFRNVLSCFTVADKRLIWNKRLQVVKSQWLEDCLEKEQRLQEEIYSLELEELDVQQWRCDMESDALSPFDCQENQNISSPDMPEKDGKDNDSLENRKKLVLPEPNNKRKQRRLAGRGTKKKVPARVKQPRRKPHRVGKPAKLSVNDSDESSSHDENISREETKLEEGDYTVADNKKSKFQETLIVKDFESPQKSGEGTQYFTREEQPLSKIPKTEMTEKHIGGYYKTPEKLEVMTDPVQAMLLDMIPSLGMTKTKTASSEDEPAPVLTEEHQPEEPIEQQPVKKKKVSYKDVAGELLKDW